MTLPSGTRDPALTVRRNVVSWGEISCGGATKVTAPLGSTDGDLLGGAPPPSWTPLAIPDAYPQPNCCAHRYAL